MSENTISRAELDRRYKIQCAWYDGATIESHPLLLTNFMGQPYGWAVCKDPSWTWDLHDYRIKEVAPKVTPTESPWLSDNFFYVALDPSCYMPLCVCLYRTPEEAKQVFEVTDKGDPEIRRVKILFC